MRWGLWSPEDAGWMRLVRRNYERHHRVPRPPVRGGGVCRSRLRYDRRPVCFASTFVVSSRRVTKARLCTSKVPSTDNSSGAA